MPGPALLALVPFLILAPAAAPGPAGHRLGPAVAHAQDAPRAGGERAGDLKEGAVRVRGASRRIDTIFYDLYLTRYDLGGPAGPLDKAKRPRPLHFAALDDGNFLLVTRLGDFFHLTLAPGGGRDENLVVRKLAAKFPIDHEAFEAFAKEKGAEKYVGKHWFRIDDLHIDVEANERVLYVSHQFVNAGGECFASRISKLDGSVSDLLDDKLAPPPRWRTLYQTVPCLPLHEKGHPYYGHQAGGRIVRFDGNYLLFAVGDYGFDGTQGRLDYPQATEASYGKILKIHRKTGRSETFSLGHRNTQGLYREPGGAIYATEHGPRGGDELNRIEEGKNYGWPHVLYGTSYVSKVWKPAGDNQNSHRGYEPPLFAWMPSIAVSNLIGVERDLFPLWRGNLLVASLRSQTVFRVQMERSRRGPFFGLFEREYDRVVYVEEIALKGRLRDMAETPNGEIWLSTDSNRMLRLRLWQPKTRPAAATVGKRLYGALCAECHGVEPNGPHGIGPNLHGVLGQPIAGGEGYDYSPALRARSSERWTRENLLAFMEDPEAFAPGTKMQFRVADAGHRRALLRYLMGR